MTNTKTNQNTPSPRIIIDEECEARTGLKRKQRWRMEAAGEFPRRIALSGKLTGWMEHEVEAWILDRANQRESAIAQRRSPNPLARNNRQQLKKGRGAA